MATTSTPPSASISNAQFAAANVVGRIEYAKNGMYLLVGLIAGGRSNNSLFGITCEVADRLAEFAPIVFTPA